MNEMHLMLLKIQISKKWDNLPELKRQVFEVRLTFYLSRHVNYSVSEFL